MEMFLCNILGMEGCLNLLKVFLLGKHRTSHDMAPSLNGQTKGLRTPPLRWVSLILPWLQVTTPCRRKIRNYFSMVIHTWHKMTNIGLKEKFYAGLAFVHLCHLMPRRCRCIHNDSILCHWIWCKMPLWNVMATFAKLLYI